MKHLNRRSLTISGIILMILACVIISSCKKTNSDVEYTAVRLIHSSPGLGPIDFYVNSYKINGDAYVNFNDTLKYRLYSAGTRSIIVKRRFSSIEYVNFTPTLAKETYYSLYVTGKPDSVTYLLTKDDAIDPATTKATIRFINLSPDLASADLKFNTTSLFSALAYKSASTYQTVDPGTYTVNLYEAGKSTLLSQKSLTVEKAKIYTILAKGLKTTAVDSLKTNIGIIKD